MGYYLQGFLVPVRTDRKDAYIAMAKKAAGFFMEYGALHVVETWGEDIRDGKVTDFRRAVAAEPGESIVFSWVTWPDRATCDNAEKHLMEDERMKPEGELPFNPQRMIFGGFVPVVDVGTAPNGD